MILQDHLTELDHLLCRCRQGELAAFTELFRRCEGRIYRLAVTILRDEQEAEDVTQEVCLRVYQRLEGYRGEASFETWLTTIIVNACRDHLRRMKVRRALPLEWLRGRRVPEDMAEQVEKRLQERQERRNLWEQVDRLEEKYRLPVILFYHEGLNAEQVAQILNLTASAVYARLNTARIKLRAALLKPAGEVLEVEEVEAETCF